MKIAIATPFYMSQGFSPYFHSVVMAIKVLNAAGIEWDYWHLSGDSYVERAKNTLANAFLDSGFTHLMMIDSDLQFDVEGFGRIISKPGEIIGGVFPTKNNWQHYGCFINVNEDETPVVNEHGLISASAIPGGFVLYSREAFERVIPHVNKYRDISAGTDDDREFYEFFRCDILPDGRRRGEDIYFFHKFIEAGGELWLEPNVTFKHYGVKGWEGNYHEFLMSQPGGIKHGERP